MQNNEVSVKDKDNLIPVNLWSGTDYSKTVTDEKVGRNNFACDEGLTALSSSTDWSSNGERSYKFSLTKINAYAEYHCYTFDSTKTHTAIFDVYSPSGSVALQFMGINWSDRSLDFVKSTQSPAGTVATLTITIYPTELTTHDELRFRAKALHANQTFYVDNWRLLEL